MDYTAPTALLKDKIILVTGAGDGIGRVAALTYASYGATVVLLGRTTTKLESVYDEIIASGAPEPGIAPMDLATATPDEIQKLAEVMEEQYGRLDGLLHNAAILGERVPVEHYDINTWMKVMQVNLHAVFLLTRIFMPLLRQSSSASLLFSSSGVGATPRAYWGAYSVSKYALEGLAKLLMEELENASHIRVNILNPGGTRTSMRATAYPNEDPATLKAPEDLMPLYLYLMGNDSEHIKGETLQG
ncbi:MAG: YciK family oxidoreductase [Pseudomonadales bacterium]|jgi:NAD(P)-dependent dehydrogenase (short-subunit alcohol dehydrogenase family)|nr:YciK family oxidoreductase [Pseudomonadales bacterium]